tara:strand:+ start:733 stop:1452 length:720 start_codon:yes stop_codon:yes gene_type:complete
MAEGIFNASETTNSEANEISYSSELVGDGKKFKTVGDLEKGKMESDAFIEQLKTENAGLRSDLDTRMTAADTLEKIREENAAKEAVENTTLSLNSDEVTNLVKTTIEKRESAKTAEQNVSEVDVKMRALYGDRAKEVFDEKASSLGLSPEYLKDVASKSPAAFYNVLGLDLKKVAVAPTLSTGSISTEGGQGPLATENSWAWFENMRKTDPTRYWKPETQNLLFKSRQEQGDKFGTIQA